MLISAAKNAMLFLLALGLAVLVWAVAQVEQNPETRDYIPGVSVEVRNVPAGLQVVSTNQNTVSLFVSAPQDVWSQLDSRSFHAWIDLTGLDAGSYDLPVHVTPQVRWARVLRILPTTINVRLERLTQKVVPVVVSVLDDAPAGFSLGTPVVTPTQLIVSGRQSIVDQVTEAVSFIRIEGARSDVERIARPVLRDGRGAEVVGNLTIKPDTVTVTVPVIQLLSYKTVAVRAVITGTVAAGYRITTIVVEPQTLTLGGDPRVLEPIAYVNTMPVDISGARTDVAKSVGFVLPPGTATERKADILVLVRVEPIPGQEIIRRAVSWVNLGKGLRVLAPVSPTVDIELSGPLADLARITASDITVTVDLANVTPGVVERVPVVNGLPRTLTVVRIIPERLIILVDTAVTPTPTSSPTRTPTPGASVTPSPTPGTTPSPTGMRTRSWAWSRSMSSPA